MQDFIDNNELILMEAAVVEPLRRGNLVTLDQELVHGGLIYDPVGRAELRRLYHQYSHVAKDAGCPFLMCTPTWRTNYERVQKARVDPNINCDAARFVCEIREELEGVSIKVGGIIGCKNDCYQPHESLSADEAEDFHAWQINQLADSDIDFLFAVTLPSISEAKGIARAMAKTGKPFLVSFVIDRSGALLDGTPLLDAVQMIDAEAQRQPVGYLINCAYPTFLCADSQPRELFLRLIGVQANASSLDHSELDCAEKIQMNDVAEWGDEMLSLHLNQGIKILGGCCGTNAEHLRYLVENLNSRKPRSVGKSI